MGQKTHPNGFRVGIIKPWSSTWYAKKNSYPKFLVEDEKIRKFIKKKLYTAGVAKILISRKATSTTVTVATAKPGVVVGRGGQGIDELRTAVSQLIGKPVTIDVVEVARIDADAQLAAESVALQLEKRIAFRRAMKQVMQRTMRAGVQGIKVMVSGRLGGAEIARSEWVLDPVLQGIGIVAYLLDIAFHRVTDIVPLGTIDVADGRTGPFDGRAVDGFLQREGVEEDRSLHFIHPGYPPVQIAERDHGF